MTSHAGWVGGVTALAEELGLAAGMPPARAEGVAAATREACLNAIEHGNGGGTTQPVLVRFEPSTEGLTVTVEDDGPRFNPPQAPPVLEEQIDGKTPARGWGFPLMRHLSDRVEVRPRGGPASGNAVRLTFLHEGHPPAVEAVTAG